MLGVGMFDLLLFILLLASFRIIWQLPFWSGMLVAAAIAAAVCLTRRDFRRRKVSNQSEPQEDTTK